MQTDQDWVNAGCPAAWCAECGCGLDRVVFRHLPTCKRGLALDMPQPGVGVLPGLELMARAEKAEQALASTRATLAEHVDENLELHRRVADLEADRERWRALASTMEPQVSELGVLRQRVQTAIAALELTRWNPNGPLNVWMDTPEGRNHAQVIAALEILRDHGRVMQMMEAARG